MKQAYFNVLSISLILGLFAIGCSPQSVTRELEERNMATLRRVHAELAEGNIDIMDEVLAPDYVRHCQAMPPGLQEISDLAVFKGFLRDFVAACPGYTDSLSHMIADSNMVAYISTMKGTQTGPMDGLPASNKPFTIVNLVMQRFNDHGKIAETWVSWDNVAMLTQLGYFPPPGTTEQN